MLVLAANGVPQLFWFSNLFCVQAQFGLAFRNPHGSVTSWCQVGWGTVGGPTPLSLVLAKRDSSVFFIFLSLSSLHIHSTVAGSAQLSGCSRAETGHNTLVPRG